ncbi:Uma2 family endonuclease [Paenibacillus hamazuiensis]|uniref:Uma2 family endonuclease n=1 Tax=Paenibacillus hamazuiensis TaxID=2936508 RepID=UPI00200BFD7C|nr:Uma2 family endonuclease [Paenibacillus hamazuiensis]
MAYELETDEIFEVWDGEVVMMTPGSPEHESLGMNLGRIVSNFVYDRKLGKTYGSNAAVYLHADLSNKDFVMPDITFIRQKNLHIVVPTKGIYGAPDLVVEIVSPGKKNVERDLVKKYNLYEQYGVPEYWIVHPYNETIDIYSLKNGRYERVEQSVVLAGIELVHEEIFY